MDNTRKHNATITTRYRKDQMDVYEGVMSLVREHTPNLSKSLAQFLLVQKGLQHTSNPEPLDIPNPGQANVKGQRASDDKLTNPNKAKSDPDSSKLALEEKKSSNDKTSVGGWIALIALFVGLPVVGYLCDKHSNEITEWWTKMYTL